MSSDAKQTCPQPHEGITGTVRDQDGLLSLDDKALAVRRAMKGLACVLRSAVMVGSPAPVVERMSQRMRSPEPGDLVMETSTMRRDAEDWHRGFGILLAHRIEWASTDEQWAAGIEQARADHEKFLSGPYGRPGDAPFDPADHERWTDHAWYIQYGPEPVDICRWVNCEFMTVPVDRDFCRVAFGTRDGSAVIVNRDDLLGSLADAGFRLREGAE